MTLETINLGTAPTGQDGDPVRTAFGKVNGNFAEQQATLDNQQATLDNQQATLDNQQATLDNQQTALAGYIVGLKMVRVGPNALTITSGSAHIEGSDKVIQAPSAIAKTGLSLTESPGYHAYLYDNGGTTDWELSTVPPAEPYAGTARSKTGDASRRYVGTVVIDASGQIYNFLHDAAAGTILYQTNIFAAPFQVASGSASTATNVSCAGVIPITGVIAHMIYSNNDTAVIVLLGNSITTPSASPVTLLDQVGKATTSTGTLPLDANRSFQYMFLSTPTANFVARVKGYVYER